MEAIHGPKEENSLQIHLPLGRLRDVPPRPRRQIVENYPPFGGSIAIGQTADTGGREETPDTSGSGVSLDFGGGSCLADFLLDVEEHP